MLFLYCICMYNVEVGGHIQQDIFLIWTNMFFMLVVAVMKNFQNAFQLNPKFIESDFFTLHKKVTVR